MQAAIGYLRVSTREQGRSGLGLAGGQCNEYYTHDYSGDAAVHCVPCQVHTIQTHGSLSPHRASAANSPGSARASIWPVPPIRCFCTTSRPRVGG